MTEDKIKENNNKIKKVYTHQEIRAHIIPAMGVGHEPEDILRRLSKDLPKLVNNDGSLVLSNDEASQKLYRDAKMILGLDNHFPLIMAIKEDYRSLAVEFANTLAKEYDCKTPSEKALIQVVVNSYIRLIDDSRRYNNCSNGGEYLSKERTNHLAVLSKQIDRANRQFISAITVLKQIKSPSVQVSVKTNTAFIAQNQQLNNNTNPDEIIKA